MTTPAVHRVSSNDRPDSSRGREPALRSATWRDIATLARLDADLFEHDAWPEPTWWAEFAERPRRQYVVAVRADGQERQVDAEADGEGTPAAVHESDAIIGYAGLDLAGSTADVMTIAVTPEARGSGVGRMLLDHLVEAATTSGADALLLEVRADNASAIGLYERSGFECLHVRRRYYQPGDVDAVIMRKLLKGIR